MTIFASDQQEMLQHLRQNGPKTHNEVAIALGRERSIVAHMMKRMRNNGLLLKLKRGRYQASFLTKITKPCWI
jgi:predicted transcriptional regulator